MCIRIPGYLSYYRSNYCDLKACFPSQTKKKILYNDYFNFIYQLQIISCKNLEIFYFIDFDFTLLRLYYNMTLFHITTFYLSDIFYFLFFLSCNIGLIYPKILQYLVFISVSDKLTSQLATVLLTTLKREILIAYDEKNRAVCMLC